VQFPFPPPGPEMPPASEFEQFVVFWALYVICIGLVMLALPDRWGMPLQRLAFGDNRAVLKVWWRWWQEIRRPQCRWCGATVSKGQNVCEKQSCLER
jgi:hypothetical protein